MPALHIAEIPFADGRIRYHYARQLSPDSMIGYGTASSKPSASSPADMHYWLPQLSGADPQDQTWRNQVLYFWKAEEPFPNKSLPLEHEDNRL